MAVAIGRVFPCRFGWAGALCTDDGVHKIWLHTQEAGARAVLNTLPCSQGAHPWIEAVQEWLAAPTGAPPPIPVRVGGTPFQRRVWSELAAIPRGEVRSYGALAAALGIPGGARAVARACAANPLAVFTPCHRVVSASGAVGGYTWGTAVKVRILEYEGVPIRCVRRAFFVANADQPV